MNRIFTVLLFVILFSTQNAYSQIEVVKSFYTDSKSLLDIEKIQNVIIEMVHYADEIPRTNFSDFLSEKLNYDYTYLANIFSETKIQFQFQII